MHVYMHVHTQESVCVCVCVCVCVPNHLTDTHTKKIERNLNSTLKDSHQIRRKKSKKKKGAKKNCKNNKEEAGLEREIPRV